MNFRRVKTTMNALRSFLIRRRAATAVLAATLLVGGLAWHNGADVIADQTTTARAATVTTPIGRAIAGGRDSYAGIVDVVSPAVVTIRTTGKARPSATQFQVPDNDLFREFFGEQFGRGSRPPRTFRQRGLGSGVFVTT